MNYTPLEKRSLKIGNLHGEKTIVNKMEFTSQKRNYFRLERKFLTER